jgi:type IV secretory pathway VirJ component
MAGLVAAGKAHAVDGGRFGEVKLVEPKGDVRGFVILFADRGGWTATDDAVASALAADGALVVEVDTDSYLQRLDGLDEECHWPEGDAESLSRRLQRERGLTYYLTPILVGIGQGGTLAGVALAEAPTVTIAGAVSVDPTPSIASLRPLCTSIPPSRVPDGFRYGPNKRLPGFWTVGLSNHASKSGRQYAGALKAAGTPVTVSAMTGDVALAVAALVRPHLRVVGPATSAISSLPLVELSVDHPSNVMAVLLSGDGGWRDLDKTIAEQMQRDGVPVVGWDSLRYFWSRKTPEQTAADLGAVVGFYMAKWHATKVALIGYSFGGGVLPFAYNRLPAELRSHVRLLALLGVNKRADFEISPRGWLGEGPSAEALAVLPELDRVPPTLVQCFYGEEEVYSACPDLATHGVEMIRTIGGHHFDGDYAPLTRRIISGLKRRTE